MKRLKKENEFFDGFMKREDFIEIYVNPSSKEYDNIKLFSGDGIRMFLHENGQVYAWAAEILHAEIASKYPNIESNIHITFDPVFDELEINLKSGVNLGDLKQAFSKGLTNLAPAGITDSFLVFINTTCYGEDRQNEYNNISDINDIISLDVENNVKI